MDTSTSLSSVPTNQPTLTPTLVPTSVPTYVPVFQIISGGRIDGAYFHCDHFDCPS